MINLNSTRSLQVALSGAVTTSQLPFTASYVDHTTTTPFFAPAPADGQTNNTTVVDIVPAPPGGTTRTIKHINIFNADTAQATVTIWINSSGTLRTQISVTLLPNEKIEYIDTVGFRVLTADGGVRTPNTLPYSLTQLKNQLINGNFDIWQRNTTRALGTGAFYVADRWVTSAITSSMSVTRQTFTLGQTDVPGNPTYYHSVTTATANTAGCACNMAQSIEDVRTFAGQSCTLSFYAKADAARSISFEMYQNFGTGGAPSSIVFMTPVKINLTTSWQKFTFTYTVPSITGKTLGTNNNSALVVSFWFDAGSTFNSRTNSLGPQSGTFDLAQIQVEAGSVATAFDKRIAGIELALCQRYYEKSFQQSISPASNTSATYVSGMHIQKSYVSGAVNLSFRVPFITSKRAPAAITVYNPVAANNEVRNADAAADCTGTTTFGAENGFVVSCQQPAGATVNNGYWLHWSADAEL